MQLNEAQVEKTVLGIEIESNFLLWWFKCIEKIADESAKPLKL